MSYSLDGLVLFPNVYTNAYVITFLRDWYNGTDPWCCLCTGNSFNNAILLEDFYGTLNLFANMKRYAPLRLRNGNNILTDVQFYGIIFQFA